MIWSSTIVSSLRSTAKQWAEIISMQEATHRPFKNHFTKFLYYSRQNTSCCFAWFFFGPFSQDTEFLSTITRLLFPQFHQSLNAERHNRSNEMSSESLMQTTPPSVCLRRPASLAGAQADSPQMTHLKCLAVRTLDSRHVNMNHATPHTATAVLFAGLLLLAQSDAQLPVTRSGSGWWGQKHTQGFWSSTQQSGQAVWRANFIEMVWVKLFFFKSLEKKSVGSRLAVISVDIIN